MTDAAQETAPTPEERRRRFWLRAGFLALLAGGLTLWTRARAPETLELVLDLTEATPGDLREVDVVVTRDGRALFRSDRHYGNAGAPQKEHFQLRATPGSAEVEATLLIPGRPAKRAIRTIELSEGKPAEVLTR